MSEEETSGKLASISTSLGTSPSNTARAKATSNNRPKLRRARRRAGTARTLARLNLHLSSYRQARRSDS
eukprot:370898-Alexandrium_andersonii.AAC.1